MGWPAHNPELYDEICRKGVLLMLRRAVPRLWSEPEPDDEAYALEEIANNPSMRRVWEFLLYASNREIGEAEGNHFASLAP